MTPAELFDRYLAGELDAEAEARLESELTARPEAVRELTEQFFMDQALRVLLADETADQAVTVSVLAVLRGRPTENFKTEILERVRQETQERRPPRPEQPARPRTTGSVPRAAEPPARRSLPAARRPGRRAWAAAAAVAAAVLAGVVYLVLPSAPPPAPPAAAFLLAVAPDVLLERGGAAVPARVDQELRPGDLLRLPEGGSVKVGFADDTTRADLRGPAQARFLGGGPRKALELLSGEADLSAPAQAGGEPVRVRTPHAEIEIADAAARVLCGPDFARLEVRRGQALLRRRSDGRAVRVEADHYAVAGRDVELAARPLGPSGPDAEGPLVVAYLKQVHGDVFLFTRSPQDRVPARPGMHVFDNQGILTEGGRARVVLEYPDTTRLEVGPAAVIRHLVDPKERAHKHVRLETGQLEADVVKQPAGKPMRLTTLEAEVSVLGTRFALLAESGATRVQVEEGAVQFSRIKDGGSIVVRSGFYAVAAPGRPLEALPVPGGVRALELELTSGQTEGEGEWSVLGRAVRQGRVLRHADSDARPALSSFLVPASTEESVLLEAVVQVDQVTPDGAPGLSAWGFGLVADFGRERLALRTLQAGEGGSVLEFAGVAAIPFEHGREGTYRLKFRIDRRPEQPALLRGKIWQGDREPDGWMIENERALEGPLARAGLQTLRAACTFSSFKVKVFKDDPR
jgi:ferric-dicitrate binding protein FerR (iron transport regulator)